MRHALLAALAAGGALALSGCATDGAYGPPRPYAGVAYGGYYDGYYGAFNGGYWGPRGYFYYWSPQTNRYHRDDGHHFRRDAGPGFKPIQGRAPAAGMRGHPSGPPPAGPYERH